MLKTYVHFNELSHIIKTVSVPACAFGDVLKVHAFSSTQTSKKCSFFLEQRSNERPVDIVRCRHFENTKLMAGNDHVIV